MELEITNLLLEGTPISSPFADEFLHLLMDRLKRNEDDFVRVKRRVVTEKKAQTRGLSLNQNFTSEDETIGMHTKCVKCNQEGYAKWELAEVCVGGTIVLDQQHTHRP